MNVGRKLVMYDVRGIQKYIFRTAKVKDAIGASKIVEEIIEKALKYATKELNINEDGLEWRDDNGVKKFIDDEKAIQVLYIGGGNAFVLYESEELAIKINRIMSKYVLENTYSLQLAIAMVDKTEYYDEDYRNLYREMNKVKADMIVSKPMGALPVMDVEIKTGYPLNDDENSKETLLKKQEGTAKRQEVENAETIIDSYVTKKGVDSNVAVVHIDGNNMGLRIRKLIEDKKDYTTAVNLMRQISYNISSSYRKVFEDMKKIFTEKMDIADKDNKHFIMEVLVAGDDITYVCNAKIAIATVEYYSHQIAQCVMYGDKDDEENRTQYGFSVCAGIAYVGSHFPFHAAYEVAEACCDSAKDRAKSIDNKDGDRIGNFVDFQICKNVHTKNLEETRRREYMTVDGKDLLLRPYYIYTPYATSDKFEDMKDRIYCLDNLKNNLNYFKNEDKIPSSLAKKLRNTYSLGEVQLDIVKTFMDSRGWKLPNDEIGFFDEDGVAKFYDALEMTDYYMDVKITEEV